MKRIFLLLLFVFIFSSPIFAKTIKNNMVFLSFDKEKKPILIFIEITRQDTSIKDKTDTSINIKYLSSNKLIQIYNDNFISDTPINKFGFNKNFLIKVLEQNQIDIGTSGLSYNFNIITLAQKKRATYQKVVNDISYKYYINTAFTSKDGSTLKGCLLFLEAESNSDNFKMPEIVFMMDNLFRSWFLAKFSKNSQAVLFSDATDFFKTSNRYTESSKITSYSMDKGHKYEKSIITNLIDIKHRLEINSTSDLEEINPRNKKEGRIFIFSEGYAHTRDNMTSIFGIRIINKK